MEPNCRQEAYKKLMNLVKEQGYVTTDDILNCSDEYSLLSSDSVWLFNEITEHGVLVYREDPSKRTAEDTDYRDYSQADYEAIYKDILDICPSLETLIDSVKNIIPPQSGETKQLAYQVIDGNKYARNRMFEMYIRIVLRIALGFVRRFDTDIEDAVSNGCVGLLYAVDKYNPDASDAFVSYASFWIYNYISRYSENRRPLIYYPVHQKEAYISAYPVVKESGCLGCEKMLTCHKLKENLLEKTNYSDKQIKTIITQMVPLESLQDLAELEECDEDNLTRPQKRLIENICVSEDDALSEVWQNQLSEVFDSVLGLLKPKQAEILRMRYGFYGNAMTLKDTGKYFNVTRERIRQIEERAVHMLGHGKAKNMLKDFLS